MLHSVYRTVHAVMLHELATELPFIAMVILPRYPLQR